MSPFRVFHLGCNPHTPENFHPDLVIGNPPGYSPLIKGARAFEIMKANNEFIHMPWNHPIWKLCSTRKEPHYSQSFLMKYDIGNKIKKSEGSWVETLEYTKTIPNENTAGVFTLAMLATYDTPEQLARIILWVDQHIRGIAIADNERKEVINGQVHFIMDFKIHKSLYPLFEVITRGHTILNPPSISNT